MRVCSFWRLWPLLLLLPAQAASLHEVFVAAWARQPEALGRAAREEEVAARVDAARAWTPQPPAISLSQKSDRIDRNTGQREWEVEVGVPLWQPGERQQQMAAVLAEHAAYRAEQLHSQWRFAGELREAWWRLQLSTSDLAIARRRLEEVGAVADDLARQLKAGAVSRLDANQAQISRQAAELALTQADLAWQRARGEWQAVVLATQTGEIAAVPAEVPSASSAAERVALLERHPAWLLALQRVVVAQARLGLAAVNLRDAPELGLAITRERQSREDPYAQSLTLKLKIPLGGDSRNRSRQAAAAAELAEAQAQLDKQRRQRALEVEGAAAELQQQQMAVNIAGDRQQLALDNFTLQQKAYRLGHIDLATRLRAEAERFDAEQALARARLEVGRAIARYNQALGVLP
ncbi:TolC family protein [Parachitinimonas caeni]|uniref:TolC family protein n=1 Tax=Parachitinimonas caeni TaxID=3031301 RepID=A0ABT7DVV8_9NEIS|nr:TolC family protein [Parachitinimonas caeni]MDK2123248.1 TolC family protein [Parachitinimonas caeni]